MEASVIIPTTIDKLSRLSLVLKILNNQVLKGDKDVEVILVCDGFEKEGLKEVDSIIKDLQIKIKRIVLEKKCLGRAVSRNRGIMEAEGRIIILMDDDMVPSDNFIKKHLEIHNKNDDLGKIVIGGRKDICLSEKKIKDLYMEKSESVIQCLKSNIEESQIQHIPNAKGKLMWLNFYTCNVSIQKKHIVMAGYFDENFKYWGHEDIDLGIRLSKLDNLDFEKEEMLTCYHLAHKSNFENKTNQSQINLRYMLKKYKKDPLVFAILLIAYIKHGLTGFKIKKECSV